MTQSEQIFSDIDQLFKKYDPTYITDTFTKHDHVIIFNDGVVWSRPLGDESNRKTFHMTTNINYIKDTDNVLNVEALDSESHAKKVFDTLIGLKDVRLLDDDTLINIVYNEDGKYHALIKNDEDYQLIVSIVGNRYVTHVDISLYEAMSKLNYDA